MNLIRYLYIILLYSIYIVTHGDLSEEKRALSDRRHSG